MDKKSSLRVKRQNFLIIMFVLVLSFSSFGCEPLRKKFVRAKKSDNKSSEIIPILEPVEYEGSAIHAQERYQYHYSMWRLWEKELYDNADSSNNKRLLSIYEDMVKQLVEMKKWLLVEKQNALEQEIQGILKLKPEIEKNSEMRNIFTVQKALRVHEKNIINSFKPSSISVYNIL